MSQDIAQSNNVFPIDSSENSPTESCEEEILSEGSTSLGKDKDMMFHEFISMMINYSSVKQLDMAKELGVKNANIISMYKQGRSKIPLNKIPKLAKILGLDPKFLVRKYLLEYDPEKLKIFESVFGVSSITENEMQIIDEIRRATNNTDPKMRTIKQKDKLIEFSKSISLF